MTLAPASTTQAVLDHHLQCFVARDLEGVLSDYAPDAVMITSTGVLRGGDALRSMFTRVFAEWAKPGSAADVQVQIVEREYAFMVWRGETAERVVEFGTETFVVRDGKIAMQSVASKVTPKA